MPRRLVLLIGGLVLILVGAVVVTHLVMVRPAPHRPVLAVESDPGFGVLGD